LPAPEGAFPNMSEEFWKKHRAATLWGVLCLLVILLAQLALSVRQESVTWDEDDHIFAGYMSWKTGDFGLNPEHPPLVKMLATLPLLPMSLRVPPLQNREFKHEAFLDGKDFLFKNDADRMLFRVRMGAAALTLLLALLIFLATREMFGTGAAFIALTLFTFDPNILAHGAVVGTDMGLSCFMFATIYAFYRYVKAPSVPRLLVTGVVAGFALASKHTGILVFPMLFLLEICELVRNRQAAAPGRRGLRAFGELIAIGVIGVAVLWAFYGLRYAARPGGLQLNPPLTEYIKPLRPHEAKIISAMARWHALPESYLYGLADVRITADSYSSYLFGKIYAHGVWFYFPSAFLIKSTLAFLLFLMLALFAIATRKLAAWREILFLTIPPAVHFAVAMSSKINIGVRHILPVYVFLYVLIAGAAWALIRHKRQWAYVVAALVLFQAVSSARTFPVYMAYCNEAFGGPSQTYRYLSDSNVDWGQQLKAVKKYLDGRGVRQCWFAYFAEGVVNATDYGIPCKPLITADTQWMNEEMDVPAEIDDPVLLSTGSMSGFEFASDDLNPYREFKALPPTAVIQDAVFVYDGHFHIPMAAALSLAQKSRNLRVANRFDEALSTAQDAVAADADCMQAQIALGDALTALNRLEEARGAYQKALAKAQSLEPQVRDLWVPEIESRLAVK
jgi:tetratricopeptide (TPR) repeat protein